MSRPVNVVRWALQPSGWPRDHTCRIVMVADLHACWPWMSRQRIAKIVDQAQALEGDMIVLLGDYPAHIPLTRVVPPKDVARELARLAAPLGVWAVFGNHDWWDDRLARNRGAGPMLWQETFEAAGIAMLNNRGLVLEKGAARFGLAGIDSQRGLRRVRHVEREGVDDLDAALGDLPEDLPAILLAHEPDIFAEMRGPVVLQLSGHTHGGQIRPFGKARVVPSKYGTRYAYGVIEEGGRHLVVSGGLGCTTLPIRHRMPPELTVVELS